MYVMKTIDFDKERSSPNSSSRTNNSDNNNGNNNIGKNHSHNRNATNQKAIHHTISVPASFVDSTASLLCSSSSSSSSLSSSTSLSPLTPSPSPPPPPPHQLLNCNAFSTCSVLTPLSGAEKGNSPKTTHQMLLTLRRRRVLQRQACLLSILLAFVFGLILGVFTPMLHLTDVFSVAVTQPQPAAAIVAANDNGIRMPILPIGTRQQLQALTQADTDDGDAGATATAETRAGNAARPPSDFPTIYELRATASDYNAFSVAFIKERDDGEDEEEEVVRPEDVHRMQRTMQGRFHKQKNSTSSATTDEQVVNVNSRRVPSASTTNDRQGIIIKSDIYWGDLVERSLPKGYTSSDVSNWNAYVDKQAVVSSVLPGCGRMYNRMVTFSDGSAACVRYRQNTDQIQGELFSFYLSRLLNLGNLAPTAVDVIDLQSHTWSSALKDIMTVGWDQNKPVVLTRWVPELEPAGIPPAFQPTDRHLNKNDVWQILRNASAELATETATATADADGVLLKRLRPVNSIEHTHQSSKQKRRLTAPPADDETAATAAALSEASIMNIFNKTSTVSSSDTVAAGTAPSSSPPPSTVLQRLIELAQWSDLIVFDYLTANLDRVVNNLYNYQWNADIMAAPAHNLSRQKHSQLLIFLDNESGLLHGYRLLQKYEAYHELLLDNLCVFREPTIDALKRLRQQGAGRKLLEMFEQTTSEKVRDVLPSLPRKSIKTLEDRIDRVLGQVQKCTDSFSRR